MRVLIVNKFWYPRGGDCVVAMSTARLLQRMGHDVAIFSMQHPDNENFGGDQHFVPQVRFDGSIRKKCQAMQRATGDKAVNTLFSQVLRKFEPQVVHLHNIHSYLSPLIAQLAHDYGCRVVWTMHDYKLLCPSYSCLRKGKPCDACIKHPMDVVVHRCMKGSLVASIAALLEATRWNSTMLSRNVDTFICPSQFMADKMSQANFPSEQLAVLPNFLPDERRDNSPVAMGRSDYYCYVGRLSPEKGVETLIETAARLPYTLKVAGDGPMLNTLRERYAHNTNIDFLGKINSASVQQLLRLARFSVMPSQWWENNPLSVIESLCAGTPVVVTDMGGLPELIDEQCGIIVPTDNPKALAEAVNRAWDAHWDYAAIARRANTRHDSQVHYRALMAIYHP